MIRFPQVNKPLRHLILGAFGVDAVRNRLQRTLADIEQWRETSVPADFLPGQ